MPDVILNSIINGVPTQSYIKREIRIKGKVYHINYLRMMDKFYKIYYRCHILKNEYLVPVYQKGIPYPVYRIQGLNLIPIYKNINIKDHKNRKFNIGNKVIYTDSEGEIYKGIVNSMNFINFATSNSGHWRVNIKIEENKNNIKMFELDQEYVNKDFSGPINVRSD